MYGRGPSNWSSQRAPHRGLPLFERLTSRHFHRAQRSSIGRRTATASRLAITLSESRLAPAWAGLKAHGRTALIPYLTAGYPSAEASFAALWAADKVADILEVGVPLQRSPRRRSYHPALHFRRVAPGHDARRHARADRTGPAHPTRRGSSPRPTRPERFAAAVQGAQGFVYLVARLGVTGATASLAEGLEASIAQVRRATPLPIAVGFGISTPAQARTVAGQADGVVVGSALVEVLGALGVNAAREFLGALRQALDGRWVPQSLAAGRS